MKEMTSASFTESMTVIPSLFGTGAGGTASKSITFFSFLASSKDKKFEFYKKYKKGKQGNKMLDEIYKYYDVSCIGNILKEKNIGKRVAKMLIQNIESLNNRLLIFPSRIWHQVTPIKFNGTKMTDGRYCMTQFLHHG